MPTANEKKALWFLALVALSGSGVRVWRANAPPATPSESAALERQLVRVDSVRALRHTGIAGRPQQATREPSTESRFLIDLDRATAEEIEALPGIGPALSQRIVAARDSQGSFGRIEALCAVNGVGKKLVDKLRPLVTFTGALRPLSDACGDAGDRPRRTRGARTRKPR